MSAIDNMFLYKSVHTWIFDQGSKLQHNAYIVLDSTQTNLFYSDIQKVEIIPVKSEETKQCETLMMF